MSLFAMIDYGLILVFFIGFTGLLLLGTRSRPQQVVTSVSVPSQHESLVAYLLLAGLFLGLIVLTALALTVGKQNEAFE